MTSEIWIEDAAGPARRPSPCPYRTADQILDAYRFEVGHLSLPGHGGHGPGNLLLRCQRPQEGPAWPSAAGSSLSAAGSRVAIWPWTPIDAAATARQTTSTLEGAREQGCIHAESQ